jgi:ABC-2 type transport system permease protein
MGSRPVLALALKDLKLAYNDGRDIIMHLLIPVGVASILGFAMSGLAGRELPGLRLAVVDEAGTPASRAFVSILAENKGIDVGPSSKGERSAVLVIRKDSTAALRVDPSRRMLVSAIEDAARRAAVRVEIEPIEDPGRNAFAVVFPGVAVMFLLFSSMGGALALLKEKWHGVLRRILAAPVSPLQIVAGKALGIFLTTFVQFCVYLGFFVLVWGVRPNGSIVGLAVMALATCACCAALSMFLACLGRTENGVHAASLLIIMGMSALGGSMIPYAFLPRAMQEAASFTVNKWAIVGMEACISRGGGLEAILLPTSILLALTAAFLLLGARLFRFS